MPGITLQATAITAGHGQTCALVAGGQVDCWGENGSTTPTSVMGIRGATAIAAAAGGGGGATCAIVAGGRVDCWGDNDGGQLGNRTITNSGLTETGAN